MYIHGNIGFRPIELQDLEELRTLYNDMTTFLQLGRGEMVSSDAQLDWWHKISNSNDSKHYTLVDIKENKLIGKLRIQNIDHVNKHCEVGIDILSDLRGKRYGLLSYRTVLHYLFMQFNMHMVYLRVGAFNDKAKRLYERLGFIETGHYKEYLYRHGRYWDYILMCMLKKEYLTKYRET